MNKEDEERIKINKASIVQYLSEMVFKQTGVNTIFEVEFDTALLQNGTKK